VGRRVNRPATGGAVSAAALRPFSLVFTDDPLARGLALAAGISVRPLPGSAESLRGTLAQEGVALVVLNAPRAAGGTAALERDWFAPLLAALERGDIGMLSLHLFWRGHAARSRDGALRPALPVRRRAPLAGYLAVSVAARMVTRAVSLRTQDQLMRDGLHPVLARVLAARASRAAATSTMPSPADSARRAAQRGRAATLLADAIAAASA